MSNVHSLVHRKKFSNICCQLDFSKASESISEPSRLLICSIFCVVCLHHNIGDNLIPPVVLGKFTYCVHWSQLEKQSHFWSSSWTRLVTVGRHCRPETCKKSTNHSFFDETLGSRQVSDFENLALLSNSTLPGGSMVIIIWMRVLKLIFLPAMIAV